MQGQAAPRNTQAALMLWVALFGIGVCWGSTQYFSKIIVSDGHAPLAISITSTGLGTLLITLFLRVRGVRLPLSRRHLIYYAICGLFGTALPNYTSYTAMRELPVGVISIVIAAVPLMTFLAAVVFRLDRPEPRRVTGLLAGAVAVLLLIVPDASLPRPGDAIWVGVSLLTGIAYTVENIYIAKAQPGECGALQTLCGLSWMAFMMMLPLAVASGSWMQFDASSPAGPALVAMTLAHLLAYGGFVWLIAQAGPVFAAQVGYVVTLSGVILGILLLGETHSLWVWLALALMLGGLALVQPREASR